MAGTSRAERRADYASTRERRHGAWIERVEHGSPAWAAGLEPGMRIDEVNGEPLPDIVAWRWEADGDVAELVVFDPADGEEYACTLERDPGEDWGIEFDDVLFDGIRTCVNACQFCFMAMLPDDARASLMVRDDDYRLSFLQGNFVTLTNLTDEDVERIIRCRMEPMNVSIHAVSPEVRVPLIGRRAMRGMEVLERLCEANIEVHGQIVLCAGINDGPELERTLAWVEERPQITSLAIVPLGYTKYSKRFSSSFSEDREASRAVVRLLEPYQRRARREMGITRFQLSDEFYLDADLPVPPAETYDGYPQFHDGIGMLRSFLDEVEELRVRRGDELGLVSRCFEELNEHALLVCGEAACGVFGELCDAFAEADNGTRVARLPFTDARGDDCDAPFDVLCDVPNAALGVRYDGLRNPPTEACDWCCYARDAHDTRDAHDARDASCEGTTAQWDAQLSAHDTRDVSCDTRWESGDVRRIGPHAIRNNYYGGDVNVTGLIVAEDLLAQLPNDLARTTVVLPEVMFNFDKVTLDGVSQTKIKRELERRGATVLVCVPSPRVLLDSLLSTLHSRGHLVD